MAIRFQCGACSQPIEVDDEWALRAVACPYCRKTVTAPSESTLVNLARIPVASPLILRESAVAVPAPAAGSDVAVEATSNPTALAAFVLACLMVVLFVLAAAVVSAHSLDFEQLQKDLQQQPGAESGSQFRAIMEYMNAHGGRFPGWFVAVGLLQVSAMAACVAAIVCGLLALRRAARRPLAVIALVSFGCVVLLFCVNLAAVFVGVGLGR